MVRLRVRLSELLGGVSWDGGELRARIERDERGKVTITRHPATGWDAIGGSANLVDGRGVGARMACQVSMRLRATEKGRPTWRGFDSHDTLSRRLNDAA